MTEQIIKKRAAFVLWAFAALSAIITFLVYLPSLKSGFVNWDDPGYVYENPYIRTLGADFWKWAFTTPVQSLWHPLTLASYAINHAIWGIDPFGYHFDNVLFHSINTLLVFFLTIRLMESAGVRGLYSFKAICAGLTTALLFGLHPLHVESVSWISERKDVLSALFFLLSILAYLRYVPEKKKSYYFAALVLFVLALLSKPMAVTLPAALLIIDFYPLKRLGKDLKKAIIEKLPFFALSAVISAVAVWAQNKSGALAGVEIYSFTDRAAVAVRAIGFYLYKTVLPLDLAPYYPAPLRDELFGAPFAAALIALILITVFCVFMRKKKPVFLAAWFYFLVTLLPVSGIMQVGGQAAADRYMYIPSLSLFVLAGVLVGFVLTRFQVDMRSKTCVAVAAVILAVLACLSVLTIRQEAVWKDSVTLWSREIAIYPERVFIAHYNRARTFQEQEKNNEALKDYTTAIRLNPGYKDSYLNRGVILGKLGRMDAAISDFNTVLRLDPSDIDAYANLATAYSMLGDRERAAFYMVRARQTKGRANGRD
ncbi:MAG: tetratricopeptide repeat protein [Deltaproteobacteria bacterium]|nr:tetratricopeptide repeat protein [Deltaproteobacteria bacterium]